MAQYQNRTLHGRINKEEELERQKRIKTNSKWKITKYFVMLAVFIAAGIIVKKLVLGWLSGNLIVNPIFSFKEVHNYGAAFNLFQGRTEWLIIAGIVCVIALAGFVVFKPLKVSQPAVSAMSLLSSGIILNTAERIQQGYVTDYIYFSFIDKFPVFNISDMMIVIGALMLIQALIFKSRDNK